MKYKITTILAASLVLAAGANAAVIASNSTSTPSTNVNGMGTWGYDTSSNTVQSYSGDYGALYLAQSFSTGTLGTDNKLSSISVGTVGDVSASTLKAYLYATDTGTIPDANYWKVGATPVATATVTLSAATGPATVTFDFSSENLTLLDNTTYAFYLKPDSGSSFVWAGTNSSSAYNGGEAMTVFAANLGGAQGFWTGDGTQAGNPSLDIAGDRVFSVTAVPEPSAALIGGLGMLALLRRRRA
jgi:hypothetical protein